MDDMNGTNRNPLTIREWACIALLVIMVIILINRQVTIVQLRNANLRLQTQDQQLDTQVKQLQNTPEHLFAQAAEAQKAKQYDSALNQYDQLVVKYPISAEAQQAKQRIASIHQQVAVEKAAAETAAQRQRTAAEAETKHQKAVADAKQRAIEESIKPPLRLMKAMVTFNSIDNPEARVVVRNVSRKTVDAFTVGIYCYSRFGDPVNHYVDDTNKFGGMAQETIRPGQTIGADHGWTLYGHDNTAKIKAVLEKVHMTDGSVWKPKSGQEVAIWGTSHR